MSCQRQGYLDLLAGSTLHSGNSGWSPLSQVFVLCKPAPLVRYKVRWNHVCVACRAAPSPWDNMAASAAEVGADIAAYPRGGLPLRPGLSANELADILAAFGHILPAVPDPEQAAA